VRQHTGRDGIAEQGHQTPKFLFVPIFSIELWLPLSQSLDAGLKADSPGCFLYRFGRIKHEQANGVVGDQVHQDFFVHHRRSAATQDVHPHGRFDVPNEQLDIPALIIKIGQAWRHRVVRSAGRNWPA